MEGEEGEEGVSVRLSSLAKGGPVMQCRDDVTGRSVVRING